MARDDSAWEDSVWARLDARAEQHPAAVAIIEALLWLGEPCSSVRLVRSFEDNDLRLSIVSYHMKRLAVIGVLEMVHTLPAESSLEHFYFFAFGINDDRDESAMTEGP
jgi:hypothetical protein